MLDVRLDNSSHASRRGQQLVSWLPRLLGLALLLSAAGCFEKTYADRMQVTVKFYEHLDLLNRNLAPDWMDAGFKLRVPLGFQNIPRPVAPAPDPNDPNAKPVKEEDLEDLRQPGYLGIKLPGMTGAWEKTVSADENGMTTSRKAYIYLLSNATLFGIPPDIPGRIDPLKFNEHAINLLAGNLGVQFSQDDWHRETFPNGFDLVQRVTCDSLTFLPEKTFEDTKMSFKVFITSQGDMQAMVIFVYPDAISAGEKLNERLGLCLETLRIPSTPQAATPAGGTGGGGTGPAL